jgi:ribosomal protein S17
VQQWVILRSCRHQKPKQISKKQVLEPVFDSSRAKRSTGKKARQLHCEKIHNLFVCTSGRAAFHSGTNQKQIGDKVQNGGEVELAPLPAGSHFRVHSRLPKMPSLSKTVRRLAKRMASRLNYSVYIGDSNRLASVATVNPATQLHHERHQ